MNQKLNLYRKINLARSNLIAMTVLTIVNIAAYFFGGGISFPFSAFFPYAAVIFGDVFSKDLLDPMLFYWGAAAASVVLILFTTGYFLSKKRYGWLTVAAVLYLLDLLFMTYIYFPDYDFSAILDFVFHFWVLYYLVMGVIAAGKLKKLPEEPPLEIVTTGYDPLQP